MKINTALILCAGYGKRLNPLTIKTPKPLLRLNNQTILEKCINVIIKLGIKKIFLNTFYLNKQIEDFVKDKNYSFDIQIIDDGDKILDTGGGILNMINHSKDEDFLIFNPDTIWSDKYINDIIKMQDFYFLNKLNNTLMVTKKTLSYDKNFKGDFELTKNLLKKNDNKKFIFIGCQILNKKLFNNHDIKNFPVSEIWDELLKKNELKGYESLNKFYHLSNLDTFKKLEDL